MKYIIVLGDGMGDYPLPELNGKTPLQKANKPTMDFLASWGFVGKAQTIPEGFPPGSDIANLSVMGYNPSESYTGRSPLEAASIGVDMGENDVSFRCNLVTLSDHSPYSAKRMIDYCSDEITTEEAEELVEELNKYLSTEEISFYRGVSYRHLMLWREGPSKWELTPPHDILGEVINDYLPRGENENKLYKIMENSYQILNTHMVNVNRASKGLKPANSAWIWGDGKKPFFVPFKEKYGVKGAVISAVDLIKGIGYLAEMDVLEVEGATGNINTNYTGKAMAAINSLKEGKDFVYIHVEAPDECGHRYEIENKVKAIENIDALIIKPIKEKLDSDGEEYKIMVLPDHYTPLSLRTHTRDAVPFAIYNSNNSHSGDGKRFDEEYAQKTGLYFEEGYQLMDYFLTT